MNKSQNRNVCFFFLLFHSHKMHLFTRWTFLQTEMIDFPTFSYTSDSKSPPFYIHEAQIRYSFWAEPPRIGHCREYLTPPPGTFQEYFLKLEWDIKYSQRDCIVSHTNCANKSQPTSKLSHLENIFEWILKKPVIEETSSKLLWYTKSDKEVPYYNPSVHCNVQRLIKLLTERYACFSDLP